MVISIYIFVTIIIDLFSFFAYSSSYILIFRTFIYALIPLISYILGNSFSKINSNYLERVFWCVGLLQAAVGIIQVYSTTFREVTLSNFADFEKYNHTFETWDLGRAVGTIGNPNTYGIFIVVFIMFLINVLMPKQKGKMNLFAISLTTMLSIYAVFLTQSRTTMIMLTFGLILSILLRNSNIIYKLFTLIVGAVLIYFIVINIPFITKRFTMENIYTVGNRFDTWKTFLNSYLFPININTFFGHGTQYVKDIGKSIDNQYLNIIMKYGLLGLLLYLYMFITIIISFLKNKLGRNGHFMVISIVLILVSDITGAISMNPDIIIFLFFIIGYYYNKGEDSIKNV